MKVGPAKTKISLLRISRFSLLRGNCLFRRHQHRDDAGFTLIEVMIVVAIMASIVVMVLPRIGNKNNQLKEVIRRFTVLSREIRHRARLENATYRIVIDMKDGAESGKSQHEYWIEKSSSRVLLSKSDRSDEEKDKDGNPIDTDGFAFDETILKKKQILPSPLWFEDVEISGSDRPFNSGRAFIHFFPEGLVQEAAVHFRIAEGETWTFVINPLTGKGDVVTKRLELKEVRDQ
ncbi:MAG: type II secretion system protein [Bdellovibrionales bacterium]|nr:type II secretion system protein [Bdellovibrionales bacterium]